MRLLVTLLLFGSLVLFGQEDKQAKKAGPPQAYKNLKLLDPKSNVMGTMHSFLPALGVQCTYCHVQGDFASDDNPKKETARGMISMLREINAKFPDGKQRVSCYTCHRGQTLPKTE
jgi:photosynthetic reaction center cytochrome c subunit